MIKQLLAGCALIIVLGAVGFLYRNSVENPRSTAPDTTNNGGVGVNGQGGSSGEACTQEAKICPDGSAVGRTGPSCTFAVCPPPNVELTQNLGSSSTTISFVLPSGYKKNIVTSDDPTYLASYIQSKEIPAGAASSAGASVIDIYNYPFSGISEQSGSSQKSPSAIMLSHTYFASGAQATTTNSFNTITEGTNTFYEVLIGESASHVQSSYYLYGPSSVLRFDITEQVNGSTDENASGNTNPNSLPQHQALQQMLATLQVSE